MKHTPVYDGPHPLELKGAGTGRQRVYKFDNGYGASVVRFRMLMPFMPVGIAGGFGGSYTEGDEWELAVVTFGDEGERPADGRSTQRARRTRPYEPFEICYTTPITDDVIGHLSEAQVNKLLDRIQALPNYAPKKKVSKAPKKKVSK